MDSIVYLLFQIFIFLLIAPLVTGFIKKIMALSQKRVGAPIYQLYLDIFKLFKKGTVVSDTTSWVFKATPYIVFVSTLTAAVFVPISKYFYQFSFFGDIFVVIYILALGRFFIMLSGLDAGSTFGGMGSSREALVSVVSETGLVVSLFTLALIAKSTSLAQIFNAFDSFEKVFSNPANSLLFIALFIVLIFETAGIPIDDPATHLELTMSHEAMILEHSGKYLALLEYSAAIKQLIFISIIANTFLPLECLISITNISFGMVVLISLIFYIFKILIIGLFIAIFAISTVKLRLFKMPSIAAFSFILAFVAFVELFMIGGK